MELHFSIHSIQNTHIYIFIATCTLVAHSFAGMPAAVQIQLYKSKTDQCETPISALGKHNKRFYFHEARQASTSVHSMFSPQSPGKLLPTAPNSCRKQSLLAYCLSNIISENQWVRKLSAIAWNIGGSYYTSCIGPTISNLSTACYIENFWLQTKVMNSITPSTCSMCRSLQSWELNPWVEKRNKSESLTAYQFSENQHVRKVFATVWNTRTW